MHIFNQSFNVSSEVLVAWKTWTKTQYIPQVMESGFFDSYKISKLITEIQDFENTYILQFTTKCNTHIDEIETSFELDFDFKIATKFGEKVLFFRTLLEEVQL